MYCAEDQKDPGNHTEWKNLPQHIKVIERNHLMDEINQNHFPKLNLTKYTKILTWNTL